ncbi:MAG TPA: hypothetical protein VFV33_19850, partial [Gemmatimonadaceae bacterium]|nr:hypothetical protein [Gemmatimonadaceae bacterium]
VAAFDGTERLSAADSTDLGMREIVEFVFDTTVASPALVLASRQSLLPTYLLYQAFAYLGNDVGRWLAAFERGDASAARRARGVVAALGGIDVLVPGTNGGWDSVATILETGPLAADVRLIPLPTLGKQGEVRLRMAKGAWRVDAAGLVSLGEEVTPIRVEPREVRAHGARDDAARASLVDPAAALTTFPGDRYTLVYQLPAPAERYELFLETRGYYLEWMRNEWTAEEDPVAAASLFLDPARALRRLAPAFKREEPKLEAAFWRSKYAGF